MLTGSAVYASCWAACSESAELGCSPVCSCCAGSGFAAPSGSAATAAPPGPIAAPRRADECVVSKTKRDEKLC